MRVLIRLFLLADSITFTPVDLILGINSFGLFSSSKARSADLLTEYACDFQSEIPLTIQGRVIKLGAL